MTDWLVIYLKSINLSIHCFLTALKKTTAHSSISNDGIYDSDMKSAYQLLGIPGNASIEDIEIAYEKVKLHYTPKYMATSAAAQERFQAVKEAYALLKDPVTRASHDRKLAAPNSYKPIVRPTPILDEPKRSIFANPFVIGLLLIGALVGSGSYMSWKRTEAAKQLAQAELATKKLEAEQAELERLSAQQQAQARAIAQSRAEAQERQLRNEALSLSVRSANQNARAAADAARMAAMEASREQRQSAFDRSRADQDMRERERQAQFLSQQRRMEDQARIRNLCMQNYGKPNC